MTTWLIAFLRRYKQRKLVRPWALAVPVLVLMFCLPLLKPIRQPDPSRMGDEESAIFATVQALVEHHSLAIDQTAFISTRQKIHIGAHSYSQTPPMLSLLLSAPYAILHHYDVTLAKNPTLVMYLLTLMGVTLPVAGASGLVYRMTRLFELARPWRALITFTVAFTTGWVSYATVLNPYAPAAALVVSAVACIIHIALINRPRRSGGWLLLTGFCVSLATVIDCGAGLFLFLLAAVIPAMRWRWQLHVISLLLFLVGATLPLAAHISLTQPVFGDWRPILLAQGAAAKELPDNLEFDESPQPTRSDRILDGTGQFFSAMLGRHGLLTHFPSLVLGVLGVGMVMHRHWPTYAKMLAGSSIAAVLGVIGLYVFIGADWHGGMFAARSLIITTPLLMFWFGAWLRRKHSPASWSFAGALLAFSFFATVIGAFNPAPRQGYEQYTVYGVVRSLLRVEPRAPTSAPQSPD